jgi:hypothetical protein
MKKFFSWFWTNKTMITGAVTGSVSGLATARIISADLAVQITTVTGILITLFAVAYTYFVPQIPAPPAP